jgi:hypothetical protein
MVLRADSGGVTDLAGETTQSIRKPIIHPVRAFMTRLLAEDPPKHTTPDAPAKYPDFKPQSVKTAFLKTLSAGVVCFRLHL